MTATIRRIMDGEHAVATTHNRQYAKEQRCTSVYNYFPQRLWSVVQSDDTFKNKWRQICHYCIEVLRLRNCDAETKRIIVATTHVASGVLDRDPKSAYQDIKDFSEAMRVKRDSIKGTLSPRAFPDNPQEFISRYPDAYAKTDLPVACPVDIQRIRDRAVKSTIPVRSNNEKATSPSSTRTAGADLALQAGAGTTMNPPECTQAMMMMSMKQMMTSFMQDRSGAAG